MLKQNDRERLEIEQTALWQKFIDRHDGCIDLYWLPVEKLRHDKKRYVEDATLFYYKNYKGWKLASKVMRVDNSKEQQERDGRPPTDYIFRTHIEADDGYLKNEFSQYLRTVMELGVPLWQLKNSTNHPPEDWLINTQLKLVV